MRSRLALADFSASLMYVLCLLFDRVWVVKPHRSRMVNSERYVVAKGMRPRQSPVYRACVEALTKAHEAATDAESIETLVRFRRVGMWSSGSRRGGLHGGLWWWPALGWALLGWAALRWAALGWPA